MDQPPGTKRPRLSLACNECRRKKIRCDTNYPSCHNCQTRNIECFTSDPKHPTLPVVREWTGSVSQTLQGQPTQDYQVALQDRGGPRASLPPSHEPSVSERDGVQDVNATQNISPVHQPHDMVFNRDDSWSSRMKMMGASSWTCLTRTLNLYLRRAGLRAVSQHFDHGLQHAEEFHLPLVLTLPPLPPTEVRRRYTEIYFDRIHRLWPLFDTDAMRTRMDEFAAMPSLQSIQPEQIPVLVSTYLILSLGADEEGQGLTHHGDVYLQAASGLVAHTLFIAYLPTVQALLLLTTAFRGRNKDGLAWLVVGMAIRVAQSIGLHRFSVIKPSQNHGITRKYEQRFHARIWGIACCLDKIMSIESGRPSPIGSVDKDQMMGSEQVPASGFNYLVWNMGIAEIQASISNHIYGYNVASRTSRQLLLDTARLDKSLLDWSNQLPAEYHPSNELSCADEDFHIAAHLSIQYHQAMIALHRAALIAPVTQFEAEVMRQCPDEPSRFRLKGGEMICVKSARAIARLTMELADKKLDSRIITAGPVMLACIVIAINLVKNLAARMQAADLELLKACAAHVREQYLQSGQSETFAQAVVVIYDEVAKYVNIMRGLTSGTDTVPHASKPSTHSSNAAPVNRHETSTPENAATGSEIQSARNNNGASEWFDPQRPASTSAPGLSVPYATASISRPQAQALDVPHNGMFWPNEDDTQDDVGLQSLPLDDYNVEDLWNWMLLIDSSTVPHQELGAPTRWNVDMTSDNVDSEQTSGG